MECRNYIRAGHNLITEYNRPYNHVMVLITKQAVARTVRIKQQLALAKAQNSRRESLVFHCGKRLCACVFAIASKPSFKF